MIFHHLTHDADFEIDPNAECIGWGAKNHAPSERMVGCLYVAAPSVSRWLNGSSCGWAREREYVAHIEVADDAVEGVDIITLSDTESLIVNLDMARVIGVVKVRDADTYDAKGVLVSRGRSYDEPVQIR